MARFLRFHAPSIPSSVGCLVTLTGDEAHHLSKVLRLGPGATLTLFDGHGTEATATVAALTKSTVDLELQSDPITSPPPPDLTIALAPPKRDFDETLTMLAELGIVRLQLLHTDHGEVVSDMKPDRLERLMARVEKVAVAAAKQSGSNYLLTVHPPIPMSQLRGDVYVCEPTATSPLYGAIASLPATLAIGPEGGWSPAERNLMNKRHWPTCALPGHVLRTGTAAIVAAAVALASFNAKP